MESTVFKTFFKRGLRALLPTVFTILVFVVALEFLQDNIAEPINEGIKTILTDTEWGRRRMVDVFGVDPDASEYVIPPESELFDPGKLEHDNIDHAAIKADLDEAFPGWLGFVTALTVVFVFGFLLATFVGSRIFAMIEGGLERFPLVKVVYPYAKQMVEFFTADKKIEFHSVVAFPWPREGLWTLGFVTGSGLKDLDEAAGGDRLVNVFIPSCPTPFTGWVVFVPVSEIRLMPLTVDEAVRFIISGGVLVPPNQQMPVAGPLVPPTVTVPDEPEPVVAASE